jgi:hypothetical protein
MRTLTAPGRPPTAAGRLIWSISGAATAIALAVSGAWPILTSGKAVNGEPLLATPTRTIIVTQLVTTVHAESYGAPIRVTAGRVGRITVTAEINYDRQAGPPPSVTVAASHGVLTLDAPACADSGCSVGFTVTVPTGISVTAASGGGNVSVSGAAGANLDSGGGSVSATGIDGPLTVAAEGGNVTVSGSAGANLDSGGGQVSATGIHGPLNVTAQGGAVMVSDLTGQLDVSTNGGPLSARGLAARDAIVTTDGGTARLTFASAPDNVQVSTNGGPAWLTFAKAPGDVVVSTDGGSAALYLPGGPYAVTAESDGGPQQIAVAADPGARRFISVNTASGPLRIEPRP